jgi:DNA primase
MERGWGSPFPFANFLPAHGCPLADDRGALIQQVKEANDIVDVVGTYVALRPAGPIFKGLCPFHDDHNPSFNVDPRRQYYRCWVCQKKGDVIDFIREHERVDFREALELLARRAGISLEKIHKSRHDPGRALMLDLVKWAAEQFHQCLLDSPAAEAARKYLGERGLSGDTVRRYALGYAPGSGEWLVQRASRAALSFDMLEKVGLIRQRPEGNGHYDWFRDRIMFPIRDPRGQIVGFGGRILPSSPPSAKIGKYINSAETPLFKKSEQLYGLDQARQAAATAGYLAVVEGYTDVLMAHQQGIPQVVSTMGTALNPRHVRHLRRFVPRVVLVFDADQGGDAGVDRALEIFVSQEVELAIATLPAGLDPCDLLVQQGPEPFKQALVGAVDALEFKLTRVLNAEASAGIEGRRRAVEAVLKVIAQAPEMPGQAGAMKLELAVTRIAQRLGIREETVWSRLKELRAGRRPVRGPAGDAAPEPRKAKPRPLERQLLQVLLADARLVTVAAAEVAPADVEHPGLRQLLEGLYALRDAGEVPDLEHLRERVDNPPLLEKARDLQDVGRRHADRPGWLRELLVEFRNQRTLPERLELQNQLQAVADHTEAVALLRRLQQRTVGQEPGTVPVGGPGS